MLNQITPTETINFLIEWEFETLFLYIYRAQMIGINIASQSTNARIDGLTNKSVQVANILDTIYDIKLKQRRTVILFFINTSF